MGKIEVIRRGQQTTLDSFARFEEEGRLLRASQVTLVGFGKGMSNGQASIAIFAPVPGVIGKDVVVLIEVPLFDFYEAVSDVQQEHLDELNAEQEGGDGAGNSDDAGGTGDGQSG